MLRMFAPAWDRRILVIVRMETKPFALGALLVGHVASSIRAGEPFDPLRLASLAMNLVVWWMYRHGDDDDDRWRRRRKQVAAKVAEVAGRLQVVPQGTS